MIPWLDIFIGGTAGISFFRGYKRGIKKEITKLVNLLGALLAGLGLHKYLTPMMQQLTGWDNALADTGLFAGSFLLIWRLINQVEKKIKTTLLDRLQDSKWDKLSGVISLLRNLSLWSAGIIGINMTDIKALENGLSNASHFAQWVSALIGG